MIVFMIKEFLCFLWWNTVNKRSSTVYKTKKKNKYQKFVRNLFEKCKNCSLDLAEKISIKNDRSYEANALSTFKSFLPPLQKLWNKKTFRKICEI